MTLTAHPSDESRFPPLPRSRWLLEAFGVTQRTDFLHRIETRPPYPSPTQRGGPLARTN